MYAQNYNPTKIKAVEKIGYGLGDMASNIVFQSVMILLLLRLVDPQYNTGTAEAFGLKQMVYEPFLGGGLITATAPIFIMSYGPWVTLIICAVVSFIFLMLSVFSGWAKLKRHST